MSQSEMTKIKAKNPEEAKVLRTVLARDGGKWSECPCGWFTKSESPKCPDPKCKKWIKATGGKKKVKLYAHVNSEDYFSDGEAMGLEEQALSTFANWGYEIPFDAEVDLRTGEVKLLTVFGHKIQY
jgi:hypothetical protein